MRNHRIHIDGIEVFYRECGDPSLPTMVLLHGFPSASHMFRDLMPALEDRFHCVAPDYPGFGQSESPALDAFAYTFDHLSEVVESFLDAIGVDRFYLYIFDYGAPIGFRIACRHPKRVLGIVSQNGNVGPGAGVAVRQDRGLALVVEAPGQPHQLARAVAGLECDL